jgi:hypothetical protein
MCLAGCLGPNAGSRNVSRKFPGNYACARACQYSGNCRQSQGHCLFELLRGALLELLHIMLLVWMECTLQP